MSVKVLPVPHSQVVSIMSEVVMKLDFAIPFVLIELSELGCNLDPVPLV
jgi:hypothetical protein